MKYSFYIIDILGWNHRGILDYTDRTSYGKPYTREDVELEVTHMRWFRTDEGRLINGRHVVTISLTKLE